MPNTPDNATLSHLIHAATQKIVANTEKFIQSNCDHPLGSDTVSIMINGSKLELSLEDYQQMKQQNDVIKMQMKKSIRELKKRISTDNAAV